MSAGESPTYIDSLGSALIRLKARLIPSGSGLLFWTSSAVTRASKNSDRLNGLRVYSIMIFSTPVTSANRLPAVWILRKSWANPGKTQAPLATYFLLHSLYTQTALFSRV